MGSRVHVWIWREGAHPGIDAVNLNLTQVQAGGYLGALGPYLGPSFSSSPSLQL